MYFNQPDYISNRDDRIRVIPEKRVLFGSLAVMITFLSDYRPMTLRHQVFLILPFGQPVGRDQQINLILDILALRHRLLAVLLLSAVWRPWLSSALGP